MTAFAIEGREIGSDHKPFIIAELSGNHNGSLDRALQIIDAAADAGADAIKLQTYTADTITIDKREGEFFIGDPASPWRGRSLHDLYEAAHTPWDWHESLMNRARERGIICFSSPFDDTAVDFLEELNAPAYKIASFECIDLNLVRKAARTGKPVIISTGMASVAEIAEAADAVRSSGNDQLALLKCTSTYPASPENTNINTIPHMRSLFQCEIGLSDHTHGVGVAVAAVALGASLIEKHLTLSRADGGVDAAFSLEPPELTSLVEETQRAWQALGSIRYGPTEAESGSLVFRRSLYIVRDLKAGDALTSDNVRSIRPGRGLAPRYLEAVLGKKVNRDLERGTPLAWEFIG